MNMNMKDGGPAFPVVETSETVCTDSGMSFREYAAVKIFAAFVSNQDLMEAAFDMSKERFANSTTASLAAQFAVIGADALIEELQK